MSITSEFEYRLHEGRVQTKNSDGTWFVSAHDEATPEEIAAGDYNGHAALPVLREKFGLQA